ncbi:MAG: uroporphyrinogen-III C-methyltransferase [Oscillibacter sp.]|nr:uroporphyrinogen-III C-methyltransferase [Oscillibacter sp.]
MAYFPFFADIEDLPVLIIGGGTVALRKAEVLLPYGPRLTVAAPEILPELAGIPGLTLLRRPFQPEDLEGIAFAVAATSDREENRRIGALCRQRGIPVNAVDDREACDFIFPSLLRRGPMTVAISTGGASPTAASTLKRQIAELLPSCLEAVLLDLDASRPQVKAALPPEKRPAAFAALYRRSMELGRPLTEAERASVLEGRKQTGCVWLVGAGCGDADLITLRGLNLLRQSQAVVYDDLIDPELLRLAPFDAEMIYVGKRSGRHSAKQEEICKILIDQARQGKQVVRLKGGDPFVFGRGGEELLALQEAGIPCGEVPGISSAIAVPAAAGIPVTHRRLSRSIHIVTGHTADTANCLPEDLPKLAALHGTLVFLMGLEQLPRLAQGLLDAGKAPETPAAVLPAHSAPVRAPLSEIAEQARQAGAVSPAVIVVGETAAMELPTSVTFPEEA